MILFSLSGSMRVAISISVTRVSDTDIYSKTDEETLRGILNCLEKIVNFTRLSVIME